MEAKKQEAMNKTGQAMADLSAAMNDDSAYAWSWHCNIACCAMDEGLAHEAANKAAARFMRLAFDVNTDKAPNVQIEALPASGQSLSNAGLGSTINEERKPK